MSNKKQPKKDVILQVNFNKTNKKKGYEGYKKSELKNMWLEMSKGARLYGDNRTANKYEKWANIKLNEHWKNGEGAKIRRMVNITSNSTQMLPIEYGTNEKGMYTKYKTPKTPRDSKKYAQFREARKEIIKTLKVFPSLDIHTQNWVIDNIDLYVKDSNSEEVNIILNIAKKSGGFNSGYSKYQSDIDRLLRGGEISQFQMQLISDWKGVETKPNNSPNTLRKKK